MKKFYRPLILLVFPLLLCISCMRDTEPVDYVNPKMGGISHLLVPTYPTVHRPNSMLRMIPMRGELTHARLSALSLFVHSHRNAQSFSLSPWSSEDGLGSDMSYSYDLEKLTPYSYEVYLEDPQVMVKFSPAERAAVYSLEWLSGSDRYVVVNAGKGSVSYSDGAVSGSMPLKGMTKAYLYLEPSVLPVEARPLPDGRVALRFDADAVTLRYGVSFIDEAQAKDNMLREVAGRSLDDLVDYGRRVWNETLSKIRVTGGTDDEKAVFYTSLYRISERPVNISEYGRYWSAFDGKVHEDNGRPYYTDDWYWDTYRAAHPLRTIIDPQMEMDMVNSSILAGSRTENGWFPMFPTVTGDTHSMNSNHGVAVVADCLSKGLDDFDAELAWQVCRNAVETKSLAPWSYSKAGRLDAFYKEHGYYPALAEGQTETEAEVNGFEKRQPVAVTLGTVYDEWCLSRIAECLGKNEAQGYFSRRALNYRKIFNRHTGFFQPKTEDGRFVEPFDYLLSGGIGFRNAYDENNGWIYRWDVPHNVADLVWLMGGEEAFADALDTMFETPVTMSKYDFWSKGPDHGALTGLFSMANEPCMHIPYLYNYVGQPWKTQKMTRKLLDLWFRNDYMGVPGDEDGGGLSSFAVFSMMGFYPVTPGLPVYALTSPVFEAVEVSLPGGKIFKVRCLNYSPENKYIRSATLNGEAWNNSWIAHKDIVAGGVLCLEMGRLPNKGWASSYESYPPSFKEKSGLLPVQVKDPVYADFNHGQSAGKHTEWVKSICEVTPANCSEVEGKITVKFKAPGMTSASAMLWRQPTLFRPSEWGHDVTLTPSKGLELSSEGEGSFTFNADRFPSGPMNVRIYAFNDEGEKDYYELQMYNKGGVRWNQGIPDNDPPGAEGLTLVFSDDFDGPLSISNDGRGARYNAHKPRFGDFSGWQFADVDGPYNPFSQKDTYLRISARKYPDGKASSGLIASVDMDGNGFWVKAPCYLECRFTAQSAPGTWPAFWTINEINRGPGDELDIIEAYGGVGPGNPNHPGYSLVSHFWGQKNPDGTPKKHLDYVIPMMELGGKSYWSTTFHTYAVRVGLEDTVYYFDDIEVARHRTNDVSRDRPHLFLVNYAIGGISGWGIDLERHGNATDMYVDYIRVYSENNNHNNL